MLAAIAADPTAVPLWLVVALAAGMYPFGFMLGSECSACCDKCSLCTEGTLPETVTVTLGGYTDKTQGPYLCNLQFSACYGDGAAGRITAPGGDPDADAGPISAVSLTSAGSGYAKLGRVIPTVTATADGGSGAEFSVTLTAAHDSCGLDYWAVSKVAVLTAGSGYVDDQSINFNIASGDTQQAYASARLKAVRVAPAATLEVSSEQGTGATFSVAFDSIPGTPPQWVVDSVTVNAAGDLYVTGDIATLTPSANTITVGPADFFVKAAHAEPTVSASVSTTAGTGAALSVTLSPVVSYDGSDAWKVSAIGIDDAGSGYEVYDSVGVVADDGIIRIAASAWVDAVDSSGAILSITVWNGGEYLKGGPITAVEVTSPGIYYGDSGEADSVKIDNGGFYYREDASAAPYVAAVTVQINQSAPSAGAGAEISATVGDDPEDAATFGKITALTIDAAGDDYLAWRWLANACCGHYMNGKPITLKRNGCVYTHTECGGYTFSENGTGASLTHTIRVTYNGPTQPPTAAVFGTSLCARTFTTQSLVTDCGDFAFTASSPDGVTASVAPGGDYIGPPTSEDCCHPCCRRDEPPPEEIAVEVLWANDMPPRFYTRWSNAGTYPNGTYVLAKAAGLGCLGWSGNGFSVRLETCDFSCQQCLKTCKVVITTPLVIAVLRGMGDTTWNSPLQGLQDERFLSFPGRPPNVEASACGEECVDACIATTPSCSPVSSTQYDFGFWAYNELFTGVVNSGVVWMNAPWWRENVRGGYYGDSCNFQNGYFEWIYSQIPCDQECDGPFNQCCQGNAPWDASIPMWNPLKYLELHPNYEDSWYGRNNTDGGLFTNRTQAGYEAYLHEMASGASAFYPWTVVLPKSFRWSGIAKLTISDAQ